MKTVSPTRISAWPTRPSGMTIGSPRSTASNTSEYHSMARAGSLVARYGVREFSRAGVYSRIASTGMVVSSGSGPSSAAMRRRSSRANAGRGASGTTGSRNVSNGSVIAPRFVVARSERAAGAHQQCFGRVHRAIEVVGDLGDRETVEVPQRQRRAVMRTELREHLAGAQSIEMRVEVVFGHVGIGV